MIKAKKKKDIEIKFPKKYFQGGRMNDKLFPSSGDTVGGIDYFSGTLKKKIPKIPNAKRLPKGTIRVYKV